jgi:hypothetical protein
MQGVLTGNGQTLQIRVVARGLHSEEVSVSNHGSTVDVIVSGSAGYLRGNAAFWLTQIGPRGRLLAGRWIGVLPSHTRSFINSLGHFAPETVGRCFDEDHGTLTVAGQTTIDGQPAIVLRDAGNAPGATPSLLAVAASGTPYPLRITATGAQRAGGRVDVCNDGKADKVRGSLTFSQFGHVEVRPPSNVLHLGPSLGI